MPNRSERNHKQIINHETFPDSEMVIKILMRLTDKKSYLSDLKKGYQSAEANFLPKSLHHRFPFPFKIEGSNAFLSILGFYSSMNFLEPGKGPGNHHAIDFSIPVGPNGQTDISIIAPHTGLLGVVDTDVAFGNPLVKNQADLIFFDPENSLFWSFVHMSKNTLKPEILRATPNNVLALNAGDILGNVAPWHFPQAEYEERGVTFPQNVTDAFRSIDGYMAEVTSHLHLEVWFAPDARIGLNGSPMEWNPSKKRKINPLVLLPKLF